METNEKTLDLVADLNLLLDSIGYKLGYEAYAVVNPVIQSVGALKTTFIEGFKRGWKEAREGLDKEGEEEHSPSLADF